MAMVLATATRDGAPSTRTVLVRRIDDTGLKFGTADRSRKGRDFAANPKVAGTFYWRETLQQINVSGEIELLGAEDSDLLFDRRTDEAKAATRVSDQSQTLSDSAHLESRMKGDLESGNLLRPTGWSGYRLRIDRIEFWHGSPDRLHRRLEYKRAGDGWSHRRLQP